MESVHRTRPSPARRRASLLALAAALASAVLACVLPGGTPGPVQTWWKSRGPVVPHDSFPADCALCHEGEGWNSIRDDFQFDHGAETGMELEGAHASAQCLRCHNDRGPVTLYVARGCGGCHEDIHRGQLGLDCTICHDQRNWRPNEQMAQHVRLGFPLIGSHAETSCWSCHPDAQVGNFTRTPTSCVECHQDDLATATSPDHLAQGWTSGCERCHIPTSWDGAGFVHPWPLTGAHAAADCAACHAGDVYAGTPTECLACHLDDYQGAADPDHVALGISTSCQLCHSTDTWEGAIFDHTGIVNGCVACHLDDYQATTDPDHVALGISTNCEQCHTTTRWEGAIFDHTGIVNGCSACHLDDYQATTDPNHTAAGFPTTCETCHSTTTWDGATFTHSPINQGNHSGLACGDCHLNPSNYSAFSCTHCHEHNKQDTDDDHDDVPGYVYASSACSSCHNSALTLQRGGRRGGGDRGGGERRRKGDKRREVPGALDGPGFRRH